MENLNKLSFTNFKIDESKINIPMEDIKMEYDRKEDIKLYMFRVLYIHRYNQHTQEYTVYLGTVDGNKTKVIKAVMPLPLRLTHRVLPEYRYDRPIEGEEDYILKERIFREIDNVNKYHRGYYMLVYGYMKNVYKEQDAFTHLTEGVQEFRIGENTKQYIKNYNLQNPKNKRDINTYQSLCFCHRNFDMIIKMIRKIKKNENFYIDRPKFNKLPDGFFIH